NQPPGSVRARSATPPRCPGCAQCKPQAKNATSKPVEVKPAEYWTAAYSKYEQRLNAATDAGERDRLTFILNEIRHAERDALAREAGFRGKLFSARVQRDGMFKDPIVG